MGGAAHTRFNASLKGIAGVSDSAFFEGGGLGMSPDEEHVSFYYEIGLAVTFWALVERAVLKVAQACTAPHQAPAILQAFYAIENFRSKLAFTDALVQSKTSNKNLLKQWGELNAACKQAAAKRNILAHRHAVPFRHQKNPRPGRIHSLVDWAELAAWDGIPTGKPPPGSLFVRDISRFSQEFVALTDRILVFEHALRGKPRPTLELYELPPRPPTTRDLKNRIRARLGLPLKPSR
jgi:hypothetical protein